MSAVVGNDRAARKTEVICQNFVDHTPGQPGGYLAWHDWAAKMARTHNQERCSGCGLFQIWVPRGI